MSHVVEIGGRLRLPIANAGGLVLHRHCIRTCSPRYPEDAILPESKMNWWNWGSAMHIAGDAIDWI
jgi:hypothetical protein